MPVSPTERSASFRLGILVVGLTAVWLVLGLPVALFATHGWDFSLWPEASVLPADWFNFFLRMRISEIQQEYRLLLEGRHPALTGGGHPALAALSGAFLLMLIVFLPTIAPPTPRRDPAGQLGAARWANNAERAQMTSGLELGLDLESGQSIRVSIEGNLLSLAPPRTGKTSGLLINNLLVPDDTAWSGPVVVIDPKGEVYQAVARRRRQLGRRVICLDLRRGSESDSDRWNPLARLSLDDVEAIQGVARALIADVGRGNEYFRTRGADFMAGAIATAILFARGEGREPTPADIALLLSRPVVMQAVAERSTAPLLQAFVGDLTMDERARDQLISTAKTGIAWLMDERFHRLTEDPTFTLTEVARGDADLFIAVPPRSAELLAPLLRWIFADLFAAIDEDRQPNDDRLLLIVDEADSLGRFDELRTALTLLPGRGVSIWTIWQQHSQIIERYGPNGAATFLGSASVVTAADFADLDTDAVEHISRALGTYTIFAQASSQQKAADGRQNVGSSETPQAVRLMRPDELTRIASDELVVLMNDKGYARHPMRLRKVRFFADGRFAKLHDAVPPAGKLR